ncbi:lysophospholipase D GDPD1-like isoform X1 [Montipora capricornis]|uniref:lysophospholipase D GDPD1-like isoform X1 n=2 Tax=Montipora capricornis TaxID=246305 RepID=UPI0035F1BE78
MLGLAIALPIVGAYIITSVVLLNFPLLLHKKKQVKFRCRHISHRGGAAENLENTMTAFHHALKMGTEMFELDVRLTADQQVVVSHDDDLSRVTDTELNIHDLKYKDLPPLMRTLKVQFQSGVTCNVKNDDCHIPLLESVFAAFPDIPINVDIKSNCDVLIDKTHKLICKYDRKDSTVWGNFSKEVTDKCYKKDPEIPIMFSMQRTALLVVLFYSGLLPFVPLRESFLEITSPLILIRRFEVSRTMKFICYVVDWLMISPILFKHLDKRGIQTYLWVLNDDSEFDFAFNKLKVAGVMTDYPSRLKNYLNSGNGSQPVNSSSSNEASELIKKQ